MARAARFTGGWLNAWRKRWSLTVAELAVLHGIPPGTMKGKLYDRQPPRADTERLLDCWDLMLSYGIAPPGWPERKRCLIRANKIEPENGQVVESRPATSAILPHRG